MIFKLLKLPKKERKIFFREQRVQSKVLFRVQGVQNKVLFKTCFSFIADKSIIGIFIFNKKNFSKIILTFFIIRIQVTSAHIFCSKLSFYKAILIFRKAFMRKKMCFIILDIFCDRRSIKF